MPGSAIIATSSETGIFGSKNLPDYSATKGAINALTKTLAMNLLDRRIRVNAVAPGPVWTPLIVQSYAAEKTRSFGKNTAFGRPAQPAELAPAFVFLAGDDSRFITGEVIGVTGGELLP